METRNDILIELKNLSPTVAAIGRLNVFSIPQGYFETLHTTVIASIKDEFLIPANNNIEVPDGYFDNLAASILDKIKTTQSIDEDVEISPFLKSLQHTNVFEVPKGYFEKLAEKAEEFSPVLYKIGNNNIFEVPQDYFKELPAGIVTKVIPSASKLVSMRLWIKPLKYAAAAMVTGLLALGVYKFTGTTNPVTIEIASVKLDPVIEQGKSMNDEKFEEALNNLSETDIAKYLEKTSTESDVSVLMAGVEENNLPNQEDYFTDEKTLEKFLKEIDNQQLNN